MAVIDNTTTAADLAFAQDVIATQNFDQSANNFSDIVGIGQIETLAAGSTLYQYQTVGFLSTAAYTEGDLVPLSKYTDKKTPIGDLTVMPYRKLTTAQAILKHGYGPAITRTDTKMLQDVRAGVLAKFFEAIAKGTGTATGTDFKAALIQAEASLTDTLGKAHDTSSKYVFFLNRKDYADWAATNNVTNDGTGGVFGITYMLNLAGITGTFVFSTDVPQKTIYATPAENIHIYVPDFSALSQGGLTYQTGDLGTIGVSHEVDYSRVSCATNVLCGMNVIPEILPYIIKSTIAAA